jgi:predicted amidohydrolase
MSLLRVSLLQTSLYWEQPERNLNMLDEKISSSPDCDVLLLPEMFTTGFSMQPELFAESMHGTAIQKMKEWAARKQFVICGSMMIAEHDKYFNRLLWVQPDGNISYYDKRHLFSLGDEQKHYTAGNTLLTTTLKGFHIRLAICYDLRFPVWLRNTEPYDVLMIVANWPERRIYAWRQLLIARAIENQCYVAAVNRVGTDGNGVYHNGCSAFINPKGEVIQEKMDEECLMQATFDLETLKQIRSDLPFLSDADPFYIQI